ncbi:MAG: hypothetical protein R3A45_11685 [Bdellovibrionota bacterium]
MKSINANLFSEVLSEEKGQKLVVYDLSRSGQSELHNYRYLKDLYDQGRMPKNILMIFSKYSQNYHPTLHTFATSSDIRTITFSHTQIPVTEKLQDFLRLHIKKFFFHIQNFIENTPSPNTKKKNHFHVNGSYDCSDESLVRPELILNVFNERDEYYKSDQAWDFMNEEYQRGNLYIQMVIDLAKENGTNVFLYWPTRFFRKPLSERFRKEVESYFDVPFLVQDSAIVEKLYQKKYYADRNHLTPNGTDLFTKWIVRELLHYER